MAILNNSPVLKLSEIVIQLFNNELLADVIFDFGDKTIYAHSFILISRSVVYEKEFSRNQGIQKLIPIQKYDYATFHDFVRFMYTDECKITNQNVTALLELSVKFKIPKLENMVIAYILGQELTSIEKFKIYEFCETENYQLLRNWITKFIAPLIPQIINSDHFTTIQPKLLESILKLDFIGTAANPIKEVDLFNALIKWMNHYCTKNGIELSQRRIKFDNLIRLIRFPIMVFAELSECIKESDNLFTDLDYVGFFKSEPGGMWNCKTRQICPIEKQNQIETINQAQNNTVNLNSWRNDCRGANINITRKVLPRQVVVNPPKPNQQFETTENLIITGLRFLSNEITSFELNKSGSTPNVSLLNMQVACNSSSDVIISLGESIVLQPGSKYLINIPNAVTSNVKSDLKTDLVHKDFTKYYKELERDTRLVEIIFKMP